MENTIIERTYTIKNKKEEHKISVLYDKNQNNKLIKISDEKYREIFKENNFLNELRYIGARKKIEDFEISLESEYNGYLMSETYDLEYLIEFENENLTLISHLPPVSSYEIGCEKLYQIKDNEKIEFKFNNTILNHYFKNLNEFKSFLSNLDLGDSRTFSDKGFLKITFKSREEFYPV